MYTMLLFIGSACNFSSVYEKTIDIPKGEWNKSQAIKFEIPVKDTLSGHNILFNIRNTNDYPYSNLFLFITLSSPKGNVVKDTVELTFADEKGKWLGHGFSGIWNNDYTFKRQVRFPVSGTYTIGIIHGMRDDVLRGIIDVGVKIEYSK